MTDSQILNVYSKEQADGMFYSKTEIDALLADHSSTDTRYVQVEQLDHSVATLVASIHSETHAEILHVINSVLVGGGETLHDNDGTYDYTGRGENGAEETDEVWTITRVTLSSPPVVEESFGAWTDRATLDYS